MGPRNERVLLLSDAGGGGGVSNLTVTFDDGAGGLVPDGGHQLLANLGQPPLAEQDYKPVRAA